MKTLFINLATYMVDNQTILEHFRTFREFHHAQFNYTVFGVGMLVLASLLVWLGVRIQNKLKLIAAALMLASLVSGYADPLTNVNRNRNTNSNTNFTTANANSASSAYNSNNINVAPRIQSRVSNSVNVSPQYHSTTSTTVTNSGNQALVSEAATDIQGLVAWRKYQDERNRKTKKGTPISPLDYRVTTVPEKVMPPATDAKTKYDNFLRSKGISPNTIGNAVVVNGKMFVPSVEEQYSSQNGNYAQMLAGAAVVPVVVVAGQ